MTAPRANNHSWYTNEGQGVFSETMPQHAGHSNSGSWEQTQQYNWYGTPTNADHQMNSGNSWNWNPNQHGSHPYIGPPYQNVPQQQATMTSYSNPTQNTDPWNWGWDESGNAEQVNNNSSDPRWNWGVENNFQEEQHTYGQHHQQQQQQYHHQQQPPQQQQHHLQHPQPLQHQQQQHLQQSWPASTQQNANIQNSSSSSHMPMMHDPTKFADHNSVPNSPAMVIADPFNTISPSENTSFQRTPSSLKTEGVKSEVISYSEHFSSASSVFNQDNYSQSQTSQHSFSHSQGSQGSFNQSQTSLTSHSQSDVNSITDLPDEKNLRDDKVLPTGEEPKSVDYSVKDNTRSGATINFNNVRSETNNIKVETFDSVDLNKRKEEMELAGTPNGTPYQPELRQENSTVEQDSGKIDRLSSQWSTESLTSQTVNKSSSSTGNNGLSSQWSTESLPSQGSDELLPQTVDINNQTDNLPSPHLPQGELLQSQQSDQYGHYFQIYHTDSYDAQQTGRNLSETTGAASNIVFEEAHKEPVAVASAAPASSEARTLEGDSLKIGEVENEEIIYPEEKNKTKGKNSFHVPKYKGQISPSLEGAVGMIDRKGFNQVGMSSSVVGDLGTQFSGLSIQTSYASSNAEGLDSVKRLATSSHRTEDGVNLETVPDNKERPDIVELHPPQQLERQGTSAGIRNDMFCPVGQDAEREPGSQWLQSTYSASPENQEVAPRPDRNQYLETGQLNEDADSRSCIPDGLHRMVPGQITDQSVNTTRMPPQMLDSVLTSISLNNGISPPRLQRMIPGQLNENALTQDLDSNLTLETSVDDDLSHRMVPGQLTEESDSAVNIGGAATRSTSDDIPPPGLRRMIPGESSSPESQGNSAAMIQPSGMSANTFQPLSLEPREPRIVTGVAQDEMDAGGSAAALQQPLSPSPISREKSEIESPVPETASLSLPQPPSERSETIGSDGVDSFQPVASDITTVRESSSRRENGPKDREHRHRDDESEDGSQRRPESPGRYRDWNYESRDRYRMRDSQGSRRNASYERRDDDADTEDYYSDHDRDKQRYRDYGGRYKGRDDRERRDREGMEKGSRQDHHRSSRRDPDHDRDLDHRGRNSNRDRKRPEYNDRDRHDRHRDRHDYNPEDYYGRGYDDYGRDSQRSRPSSRSDYDDYRRSHGGYGGYPGYYGRHMDPYYDPYYSYQYYENLRRTNPAAYRAWYEKYCAMQQQQQQTYNQNTSYSGERGSVHSGRSSANEDLNKERILDQNDSLIEEATSSASQRLTPAKFSTAHVKGVLTARGQLIKVCPHYPLDGQPATVEIHDIQALLGTNDTVSELQNFPGPLVKDSTHKNSVINFCQEKIKKAEKDPNLHDRESVVLLWRFLVLLLRLNGKIEGSDIAELLLSNADQSSSVQPSPATSHHSIQDLQVEELSTNISRTNIEEEITNEYRKLLLYGNTKGALEWAMKNNLWGHALFLASKMDQRTYAQVMIRFANGLSLNDPLQTLYQMMYDRQPAAVTCCGDEKWGDWKPHLAMILSNSRQKPELHRKAIMILGDTLGARGCLHASHFCYLMAGQEFGDYSHKSSKIVLIGSSHHKPFEEFATNEAIQMTEIYHYASQLAGSDDAQAQFQIYKYIYALRLAEMGMPAEAIHYIEAIAGTIVHHPLSFRLDFIRNVIELAEKLKLQDPLYSTGGGMEVEMSDPEWLEELRKVLSNFEGGLIQPNMPSYGSTSNLSYSEDSMQHGTAISDSMKETSISGSNWEQHQQQQYHEQQQYNYYGQQSNWNYQQVGEVSTDASYQADSSIDQANVTAGQYWGTEHSVLKQGDMGEGDNSTLPDQYIKQEANDSDTSGMPDYYNNTAPNNLSMGNSSEQQPFDYSYMGANTIEDSTPRISLPASAESSTKQQESSQSKPNLGSKSSGKDTSSRKESKSSGSNKSWWIGGIWDKLSMRPKNQMKLPDDKNPSIVWDSKKNRWVNVDGDDEDGGGTLAPPPKASELPKALPTEASGPGAGPAPPGGTNKYKFGGPVKKPKYVNVLGGNTTSNPVLPPPADIFPNMTNTNSGMNYFVPEPVASSDNAPMNFLTPATSSEQSGTEAHLSRWSSTSSLSREVQKYTMRGHQTRHSQNTTTNYGAPAMFNPADFTVTNVGKKSSGLKRYPN